MIADPAIEAVSAGDTVIVASTLEVTVEVAFAVVLVVVVSGTAEVLGTSRRGTVAVRLYWRLSEARASLSKVALYVAVHPDSQHDP